MRRHLRSALLGATAVLGLGLGLEIGTRLLGLRAPTLGSPDPTLWQYDRTKGWGHVPHANGRAYAGGPDGAGIRINSRGFRGREIAMPKRVPRVLVFGDSFAFGLGVDEDHLLSRHLERLIGFTGPVEVVNLGVSGYSTDQEYVLFQELGAQLAPDVVLLVMCDNDFVANTRDFMYRRYYKVYFDLAEGRLVRRSNPVPRLRVAQRAKLWMSCRSNLWNLVRTRRAREPLASFLRSFDIAAPRTSGQDPIDITFAIVRAFAALANRLGAEFLTTNTGHRGERTDRFHALRPRLDAADIAYLGLEAALGRAREVDPERDWDFGDDTHWNVDAHRLAANVVYRDMRRRGYLHRFGTSAE